jgi:anti-anti-sigma factor
MFTTDGDKLTVRFPARLDAAACQRWEDSLLSSVSRHDGIIAFDLSDVTFLASGFLRICLKVRKDAGDGRFTVKGASPDVRKVFKVAGLDAHVTME